jgi:Cu+-exporting ATPase
VGYILEKLVLQLENLACPVCAQNVGVMLNKTKGVEQAEVFFNTSKAKITYDAEVISPAQIIKAIQKMGYNAKLK